MKIFLRITLVGFIIAVSALATPGQETGSVSTSQNSAEGLRAQLSDVQAKEAELQTRERQLDEDLRPENIERSILGVGTTHPEELREQRRRQLENERTRVRRQLDQLAQSRTRLEAAIATADAEAYRRSALVNDQSPQPQTGPPQTSVREATKPPAQKRQSARRRRARRRY
ncbi:MAG TPA: hypothetical protein VGC64_05990 [Pyrinomonadaceae bacterium]|jgi:chromosome segregation ATPase